MTAISGKYKNRLYKKINNIKQYDTMALILFFILGFCAGRSIWNDAVMSSLVMVVATCTKDILCRYAVVCGGLLSVGILAVQDTLYIPYFLGIIIFVVVNNFVKKDRYAVMASLFTTAVSKSLLVYYGLSFEYSLYRMFEAVGIYFIAQLAVDGIEQLKSAGNIPSFTDAVCILTAATVVAVSVSGADSHWIYPGYALVLAASWYYTSAGRLGHSLICLMVALLTVADKQGFMRLFIATSALWLVGCYFSERLSAGIYPGVGLLALIINLISVSHLGSLALTGSGIMALVMYTVIPHMTDGVYAVDMPTLTEGRDWRLLMLSMQKLEDSLSFLAGCVIDISRLNEKQLKSDSLEDMVAEDICRKCSKNHYCWQEKYSFTQQQFSEYGQKMYWAGENRFSAGFCAQCINVGDVIKSFEENSRLLLSKKYIAQSQKNNQKMLQNAFLSISSAVGDMIYRNQHSYLLNSTITMETERFLNNIGIQHTYCLCSQNPDQASFSVLEPIDEKTVYKIQNYLEKLYSARFLSPETEQQGVELLYIFRARPVYECETALETSRYKNINGDNRDCFIHNGKAYVLLSDGMGTGSAAAAESHTVIAMAKSLIMTGVSMKNIISIINLAMNLKGSGEAGASIDILETDLFTGKSTITKAGAGVSMVINQKGVTRYYQDSLPLGILKEVKPVECSFTLKAGDTVLLMSDGAGVVSGKIREMHSRECRQIARFVIEENSTADDKTAIALRLKIAAG